MPNDECRKHKVGQLLKKSFHVKSEMSLLIKLSYEVKHDAINQIICNVIKQWVCLFQNLFTDNQKRENASEYVCCLLGNMVIQRVCDQRPPPDDNIQKLIQLF